MHIGHYFYFFNVDIRFVHRQKKSTINNIPHTNMYPNSSLVQNNLFGEKWRMWLLIMKGTFKSKPPLKILPAFECRAIRLHLHHFHFFCIFVFIKILSTLHCLLVQVQVTVHRMSSTGPQCRQPTTWILPQMSTVYYRRGVLSLLARPRWYVLRRIMLAIKIPATLPLLLVKFVFVPA